MEVGTPIKFYRDVDRQDRPAAAFVLQAYPHKVLRVAVLPWGGGSIAVEPTVYHIDDPRLWDGNGRLSPVAQRSGAWDYHPQFQPQEEHDLKVSYTAPAEKSPEDRVRELAKEHDFEAVCRKVRSLGLSKADVEKIYINSNLELISG